jgi:nicotinamidase-related amidase
MRTALIVIDMQQALFASPKHDAMGTVSRINELADRVRAANGIVIWVQHCGPQGDAFHPDQPGWRLLPELQPQQGDHLVRKASCDAFLDTDLAEKLAAENVGKLIVTGCATDFCVDTTIRSALARRFATIVPTDGHTTSDRSHLPATKVMEHHHAIWADFISPAGPAKLMRCNEIDLSNPP